MSAAENKAVFLSYASQDAEAVERIAAALRAAGVEVWFDKNELTGGDAWDQKIRNQIKACALFVPVISAATQARREGYFRLEWRIAAQRTHMMSESIAFLLPVVIDATRDGEADVPAEFKVVQWTRLSGGESSEKFCQRVKTILGGSELETRRPRLAQRDEGVASPTKRVSSRSWLVPVILGAAVIAAVAFWQPWRRTAPALPPVPAAATGATEIARVRARIVPERWQNGDFEAVSATLDRLIQTDPENGDAWALRSFINSLQVLRIIDPGTKPLEAGRAAAEHARRIAPDSPLANLALGMHFVAMISRGGDPQASRAPIDRAVAAMPNDPVARYADLVSRWLGYDFDGTRARATAWLAAEPTASYPAWILTSMSVTTRRPVEVEKWSKLSIADPDITGARTLTNLADMHYYLRADLRATRATIERVPIHLRTLARVVVWRWLLAMAEQKPDEALQELARVPDPFLFDISYNGPKALLAGVAHQRAGRAEAALAQFREAERLLREKLADDTDNEALRAMLAVALASAGRSNDARQELALVEPLVRNRPPTVYRGRLVVAIMQAYGALRDYPAMAFWLRKIFVEPSGIPLGPASFRLDPRFNDAVDAPEIQALLKEFAPLDQLATGGAADDKSAPADKSVAVLAFADLSAAHDSEYFSDGISDELINTLGKVPGLKVPARTSSFHFKGKDTPIPEIAQQLGVAYVIEGSVQRAGDKVKIGARLTKAADGFQVWSESFTRDAKDVFAVEEEIAGLIAKNLSLKLGASSAAATASVNPQAFELYVQGRQAWNRRTKEGYAQADTLFAHAIELDSNFARAYVGRADVLDIRGWDDGSVGRWDQRKSDLLKQIHALLERAIALDPDLAEAQASLGTSTYDEWNFAGALRAARRAVQLNPNYATGWHWLGEILWDQGAMDEALADVHRAVELDPLSMVFAAQYSLCLRDAGRPNEALTYAERALSLQPESPRAIGAKAMALLDLGRAEAAVPLAHELLKTEDGRAWWGTGMVVVRAGLKNESETLLAQYRRPGDERLAAPILALLGRAEEFFAVWQTRPMVTNQPWYLWEPRIDALRQDPKFLRVLEQVGLTEAQARIQAWRAAHPPEKTK